MNELPEQVIRTTVPDPSFLTTDQLLRENSHLLALVLTKLEVLTARLDGMDKATVLVFQSHKEAAAKSEAAFTKQIDGLSDALKTAISGISDRVSDLKDRITAIEGKAQGGAAVWAAIGLGIVMTGILVGIFFHLSGTP